MDDYEDMEAMAVRRASEAGFARSGDNLVITAGLPLQTSGVTNIMRLLQVEPHMAG
jgi:pyruvate kinase